MNSKNYKVLLILVSAIFSFSIPVENAQATVGGPTYISAIASKDNAVYYTVNDGGGRGCPAIIHRVDLATRQDTEVKSCDEFEREFSETEEGRQKYSQFIADTYQSLSYLGSVSLKKNNIAVRVDAVSERAEGDMMYWTEFRATISQNSKVIAEVPFRGCSKDQPHIFEGYMIPDTDAMAVLISNKGDCFEGGYVKEHLSVIKGIQYYDTNIIRGFKQESATEPNLGNVVVYASQDAPDNGDATSPSQQPVVIASSALAALLGIALGYIMGRRSVRPTTTGSGVIQ